jgi:predicted permease
MTSVLADLRYAVRGLTKVPAFTAVAVLSIGFGLGANAAVFTLIDQVLLQKLPVSRPGELAQISARNTESYGGGMGDGTELSYAMYRDLRDHNEAFAGMFCRVPVGFSVGYANRTELVEGDLVSGSFFPQLGVKAAVGRLLTADDDRAAGARAVAVLSFDYWKARFNGDPAVVGRAIRVNGHSLEVVGVVQNGFAGLDIGKPTEVFVPITMQPQMGPAWLELDTRRFRWVQVFGRLRPGVSIGRAQASLQPLYRSLLAREATDAAFAAASADTKRRFLEGSLTVEDASRGHSGLHESVREPLLILMAIGGGVLLIVCANVANLLIARGAARQRELALRMAIGASRRQLVRLLGVESLVLALAGAAVGILLASWGASMLLGYYETPETPLAVSTGLNWRILLFTSALAVVTSVLAGLAPALRSAGVDPAPALKSAGAAAASERPRLRKALVAVQVALSFVLLIGAGLFVRSLQNLLAVNPGFHTTRMLTFSFDLARSGYDVDRSHAFVKAFHDRISAAPGVSAAAFSFQGLLGGGGWGMGFTIEGYRPRSRDGAGSMCNAVSPGYFKAMGIPLLAGREFDSRDDRIVPPPDGWPYRVAVVNETFAKRYFNGANPIGRHVGIGENPGTPMPIEIVGVARNSRYMAIREDERPQIFFPYLQAGQIESVTAYVRTAQDPPTVMQTIRREVARLDPQLAVAEVSTLEERIQRSVVNERLIATLSSALSAMATLLSLVGLYGVIAYTVTRRTREIGIRMALGALASQVTSTILREAVLLVAVGIGVGLVAAFWLGRYVQNQLYGLTPADPWTIAAAAIALALVAGLAALVPARRAAHISPMAALRQD